MTIDVKTPLPAEDLEALRSRVYESFGRHGLMHHLRAQVLEVAPGRVRLRLPYRPEVTQQHGFFHGGTSAALADVAAGYAAFSTFPPDRTVLTVEFKMNYLAPARGEWLEAIGTVVKAGRTLTVCTADVFAVSDGRQTLAATGLFTMMQVPVTADAAA